MTTRPSASLSARSWTIMAGTSPYAISAARHLGDRPMRMTVSADGGQAPPDAGQRTDRRQRGLAARPAHGGIYRVQFMELQGTLDQEQPWELDGEVMSSSQDRASSAIPTPLRRFRRRDHRRGPDAHHGLNPAALITAASGRPAPSRPRRKAGTRTRTGLSAPGNQNRVICARLDERGNSARRRALVLQGQKRSGVFPKLVIRVWA